MKQFMQKKSGSQNIIGRHTFFGFSRSFWAEKSINLEDYSVIFGKGLIVISLVVMMSILCYIFIPNPTVTHQAEETPSTSIADNYAQKTPLAKNPLPVEPSPAEPTPIEPGPNVSYSKEPAITESLPEEPSMFKRGNFEISGNPFAVLGAKGVVLGSSVMLGKKQGDRNMRFSKNNWTFTGEYSWLPADESDDGFYKSYYELSSKNNEKYWIAGEYIYKPPLRKLIGGYNGELKLNSRDGGSKSYEIHMHTGYGYKEDADLATTFRGLDPIFSHLTIGDSDEILKFDPRFQEEGEYFSLFFIDDAAKLLMGLEPGELGELQLTDMTNFIIYGRFLPADTEEFSGDIYITNKTTLPRKLNPADDQKIVPSKEDMFIHVGTIELIRAFEK